jgi:hypothetical protein
MVIMDSREYNFNKAYTPVLDPGEKIARWYYRIPKYYYLNAIDVDFDADVLLDVGMVSGLIWDISVSCDTTDWSMILFTTPNQIMGSEPVGTDMQKWGHTFVFATGDVPSEFFKYQYYEMSPIFFDHYGQNLNGTNNILYARFIGNMSEVYIRMVLTNFG